ncbi:MAG TPA: dihydroxyacetone kinase subunit DhaL [Bacillota bacterium]|nr:dihydroxyacetone kinase subunit DhaL [Bacillota bacterium]
MELNVDDIVQWMINANDNIQENKDDLTTLDQPIGDGDHGINMARGFQEVVAKVSNEHYDTVGAVLKDVAVTLMSKVGGASGPLFGTAFLQMSMTMKALTTVDRDAFVRGLTAALDGVKQRGKADAGEKTMIDVWQPVVTLCKETSDVRADELVQTAQAAMEKTKDMLATKGRAAYFKEKSIGHIDPGAASSYYIFSALAEVLQEKNE